MMSGVMPRLSHARRRRVQGAAPAANRGSRPDDEHRGGKRAASREKSAARGAPREALDSELVSSGVQLPCERQIIRSSGRRRVAFLDELPAVYCRVLAPAHTPTRFLLGCAVPTVRNPRCLPQKVCTTSRTDRGVVVGFTMLTRQRLQYRCLRVDCAGLCSLPITLHFIARARGRERGSPGGRDAPPRALKNASRVAQLNI